MVKIVKRKTMKKGKIGMKGKNCEIYKISKKGMHGINFINDTKESFEIWE